VRMEGISVVEVCSDGEVRVTPGFCGSLVYGDSNGRIPEESLGFSGVEQAEQAEPVYSRRCSECGVEVWKVGWTRNTVNARLPRSCAHCGVKTVFTREDEVGWKVKRIQEDVMREDEGSALARLATESLRTCNDVVVLRPVKEGGPSTVVVGDVGGTISDTGKGLPSSVEATDDLAAPRLLPFVDENASVGGIRISMVGVRFRKTNGEPIIRLDARLKEDGHWEVEDVLQHSLRQMLRLVEQRLHIITRHSPITEANFEGSSQRDSRLVVKKDERSNSRSALLNSDTQCGISNAPVNPEVMNMEASPLPDAMGSDMNTIVFFDWDDTLMPSSHLKHRGVCGLSSSSMGSMEMRKLSEIEQRVIDLLGHARKYAMVILITNASQQWIEFCLRRLMPKLNDFLALSDIKFISARTQFRHRFPDHPKKWKVECFFAQLKSLPQDRQFNVVVVGDSIEDVSAGHEALKRIRTSKIKAVKLKELPTLDQLKHQLEFISNHLELLVKHPGCVELRIVA